ncbi:somatostatin receptor type 5 [Misgurnus anguillicaudatus]|uniref:somatostatin receptor type 5 n=1 Tax=Misgurnus anguillicaudatus TaxID=75329 RepID=UPI003CCEFF50
MEILRMTSTFGFISQRSGPEVWSNVSDLSQTFPLSLSSELPPIDRSLQNSTNSNVLYGPDMAGILIPLIYITVCIVGLIGNTLVIHIVLRYSPAESVTNIYILNLAIADELFMLGLPFLAVQNGLLSWPFGSFMCRLVMTVDAINQFTSIFCLTVMSIDRYLAVVHPLRSCRWRQPRVAKVVNATVWAVSFVVVLPVVAFADVLKDDGNCSIVWPEPAEVWKATFIIYTATVGFFGPLTVICLCYLLIVVKVRSSGRKVRATSIRRRKSERKITRMVVIVVAVFVLCWLPFYVLNIVNLLVLLPGEFRGLYYFVVVLSYANSCANPILYGFLSDNFKRGFRKALCRSSRRVENQDQRQGTGMVALPLEEIQRELNLAKDNETREVKRLGYTEEADEKTELCGNGRGYRQVTGRADGGIGKAVDGRRERSISLNPEPTAVSNGAQRHAQKVLSEKSADKITALEISYL